MQNRKGSCKYRPCYRQSHCEAIPSYFSSVSQPTGLNYIKLLFLQVESCVTAEVSYSPLKTYAHMPKTDVNTHITKAQKSLPCAFDPRTILRTLWQKKYYICIYACRYKHVYVCTCHVSRVRSILKGTYKSVPNRESWSEETLAALATIAKTKNHGFHGNKAQTQTSTLTGTFPIRVKPSTTLCAKYCI